MIGRWKRNDCSPLERAFVASELTPGAFDSKNQSYPNVVEVGDELWMFYAGNTFGATGVGLAIMKKADLR